MVSNYSRPCVKNRPASVPSVLLLIIITTLSAYVIKHIYIKLCITLKAIKWNVLNHNTQTRRLRAIIIKSVWNNSDSFQCFNLIYLPIVFTTVRVYPRENVIVLPEVLSSLRFANANPSRAVCSRRERCHNRCWYVSIRGNRFGENFAREKPCCVISHLSSLS